VLRQTIIILTFLGAPRNIGAPGKSLPQGASDVVTPLLITHSSSKVNLCRSNPAASCDPRVGFTAFSDSLANRSSTDCEELASASVLSDDGMLFSFEYNLLQLRNLLKTRKLSRRDTPTNMFMLFHSSK